LNGTDGREYGYLEDSSVEKTVKSAVNGHTVVSTIDITLQSIVEKHILAFNEEHKNQARPGEGSKNTAVIIMNPNTGAILAMADYPTFDLNNPRDTSILSEEDYKRITWNVDDLTDSEKEMEAKLLGTTPTEYGFMSTGVARGTGFSGGIKLNIYAPKGTKMAYVEPFSAFGHGFGKSWDGIKTQSSIGYEAEMLLQRNTQFRVIKVEKSGSQWYIDMEVISQKR
jgi:hypothetical protein